MRKANAKQADYCNANPPDQASPSLSRLVPTRRELIALLRRQGCARTAGAIRATRSRISINQEASDPGVVAQGPRVPAHARPEAVAHAPPAAARGPRARAYALPAAR